MFSNASNTAWEAKLEVIILDTPADVAQKAARILAHQIARKAKSVLGLATGKTMIEVYGHLVQHHRRGLSLARIRTFNLDEYCGLPPEHPSSYHSYMRQHLFSQVDIPPEQTHVPEGMCPDVAAHCHDYQERIAQAGGLDLQLLGLGEDGHIGFNEPSSSLSSRMRIKTLTPMTQRANQSDFPPGQPPPLHVLTLGVGNILEARHCLLLAHGSSKSQAVSGLVEGPVTASCPASALQLHPNCTVIIDEAAAARLSQAEYFRFVYRHKPQWQIAQLEGP